jgi:hypothetical protein
MSNFTRIVIEQVAEASMIWQFFIIRYVTVHPFRTPDEVIDHIEFPVGEIRILGKTSDNTLGRGAQPWTYFNGVADARVECSYVAVILHFFHGYHRGSLIPLGSYG